MRHPVAFIIFNRSDTAGQVFARIREARPPMLLVIADGPRTHRAGEAERCAAVRRLVLEGVDWPCEVRTCFSEANLGCRKRVSSGISWVFEQVERAIILEDDCLPDPSFFAYCDHLLERYADDERVTHIAGTDYALDATGPASWRWARLYPIWGWATWRRAWRNYDPDLADWPDFSRDALAAAVPPHARPAYWREVFAKMHAGFDTWDYQWILACWRQHGLAAIPARNLISNIGFGDGATHTRRRTPLADLPLGSLPEPLIAPTDMVPDAHWEAEVHRRQYARPWLLRRMADVVRRLRRP
jgi:hypothetical protein